MTTQLRLVCDRCNTPIHISLKLRCSGSKDAQGVTMISGAMCLPKGWTYKTLGDHDFHFCPGCTFWGHEELVELVRRGVIRREHVNPKDKVRDTTNDRTGVVLKLDKLESHVQAFVRWNKPLLASPHLEGGVQLCSWINLNALAKEST